MSLVYDINSYTLTILCKTRNEVYLGVKETEKIIFKYHNDGPEEGNILTHLKGKISNIPTLYERIQGPVTSPSGSQYKELLIMNYFEGKLIDCFKHIPHAKWCECIDLSDDLDVKYKKTIITNLINIIAECHEHGVIHGDDYLGNSIVSDAGEVYLIDFGNAYFINDAPKILIDIANGFLPERHDTFYLLNFIKYALNIPFPLGNKWKTMKARDLLQLIA
ncbi:Hypothetical protein HVR_LOCUS432 [uncultured virus]|nr:Hypothetical protein HVR_LOCUS432 [uncultured virus]